MDAASASDSLNNWYTQLQIDDPSFIGNLYVIPAASTQEYEQWLIYPEKIYHADNITPFSINTSGSWPLITLTPSTINTGSWIPPVNMILLAFVDETNPSYHPSTLAAGFNTQPNQLFIDDYDAFVDLYDNTFNFFRGVLYPIVDNPSSSEAALVLQGLAAIEGTTGDFSDQTPVDVSLLLTTNPYEGHVYTSPSPGTLEPLKERGWVGVFNKTSGAAFSSITFGDELNTILGFDGSGLASSSIFPAGSVIFIEEAFITVNNGLSFSSSLGTFSIGLSEATNSGTNGATISTYPPLSTFGLTNSYEIFFPLRSISSLPTYQGYTQLSDSPLSTIKITSPAMPRMNISGSIFISGDLSLHIPYIVDNPSIESNFPQIATA